MAEERSRIHTRITPETERKIAAAMPLSNCQTQNEFVEKALQFYCDYAASQDCFSVLPPMLVAAIRATVQTSENHICRLDVQAGGGDGHDDECPGRGMEIPEEQLRGLAAGASRR